MPCLKCLWFLTFKACRVPFGNHRGPVIILWKRSACIKVYIEIETYRAETTQEQLSFCISFDKEFHFIGSECFCLVVKIRTAGRNKRLYMNKIWLSPNKGRILVQLKLQWLSTSCIHLFFYTVQTPAALMLTCGLIRLPRATLNSGNTY